jgi:hypothetical protein
MVQKQLAGRGKNGDRPRLSRVGYCSFNLFVVCPRFRPVVVRLFDKSGGSDFSHFVVVDGVTTKTVFLLLLFVILMVRSISVLLLPLREISRVRLLFLGVLWDEIKY